MSDAVDLYQRPEAKETYMIVGWRQWADAGSVSSGLPEYLIEHSRAQRIGIIRPDGFYLFQIPGTHDLVRPEVKFNQGYPESLNTPRNEFYYAGNEDMGLVIFIGDEPHLDVEGYVGALLSVAKDLGVKRIIGLGGVYGEMPYDKERLVSANYSLRGMREEIEALGVSLSDYQGGASIGSVVCRRAGDMGLEYTGLYAFVPSYDFSEATEMGNGIRLENDFSAWLAVMRRINYMLKLGMDLTDLEQSSQRLIELMDAKVDELDTAMPQLGIRDRIRQISEDFTEVSFNPLDEVWENEIRRLFDKFDEDEPGSGPGKPPEPEV